MNNYQETYKKEAEREYSTIVELLNLFSEKKGGGRDFKDIGKSTGLSASWLSQFADGLIKDAGFKKITILRIFLSNNGSVFEQDA